MHDVTLHRYRASALTLADAIAQVGPGLALGLFYTPNRCVFGRPEAGLGWCDADGQPLALDQVFEARLFNPEAELHWLRDPVGNGVGRVVLLTETANGPAGWSDAPLTGLTRVANHHLLWGQWVATHASGAAPRCGWVVLASARIGELPVPFAGELGQSQGLRLVGWEYIGDAPGDEHGNRVIRTERLSGLEAYGIAKPAAQTQEQRP